jgi:hypothetical protein
MFATDQLDRLIEALDAPAPSGADGERDRGERRARGVFFTPQPLVDFVVDRVTERFRARREIRWRDDGSPELRFLDPAAGDGRFVLRLAEALADLVPRGDRDAILARCAVAVERDPRLAALASERLGGAEVRCAEALGDAAALGQFDLIASNPPYLRSIHLGESDAALWSRLRGRYRATSFGEWDLYAAFIEQSLGWLAPGGVAGLVVPSRWLTARFARELRAELVRRRAVAGLIDFDSRQVFAAATTYCSVLFLEAPADRAAEEIAVARLRDRTWSCGTVAIDKLGAAPWRLSVGAGRRILEQLEAAGPRLGERARVVKGTGTNADAVYVFEGEPDDGDPEPALMRRLLRGRDVAAYGAATDRVRALVPYHSDGSLLSPAELAAYPRARAHLERHRARLESRERGRFRGDRFYQYGRPQNLRLLFGDAPRVVIPDVFRAPRAMLDAGALVLDSAYVVVPGDPALAPLILAVLNSPAVYLFLRETGVPLRGGYRRMKTAYLCDLPLPDPESAAAAAIIEAVEAGSDPTAIDALVRAAYAIERPTWRPPPS